MQNINMVILKKKQFFERGGGILGHFNLWNVLLELLFPSRCVFCNTLLKDEECGFCAKCQKTLPWIIGSDAEQTPEFISCCVSPLWFRGNVRESIHRYKFSDRSGYAKTYGHLLAQCICDHLTGKYDLITWVPLSSKRLRKRGYDQAMLLSKMAALELGEVAVELLHKVRNTDTQSRLKDDSSRRANVLGAYEVTEPTLVVGKRILLIDDVVTTGATLSECARVLRMCGAEDVVCAALARSRGN